MPDTAGGSMSERRIREGYAARATEYTELFGDIAQMDAVDRERIGRWADGADGEPFAHAVTTAHFWSVDGMSGHLERAGFAVIDSEARVQEARRPHASISAVAI
jgi:hypothetical protein